MKDKNQNLIVVKDLNAMQLEIIERIQMSQNELLTYHKMPEENRKLLLEVMQEKLKRIIDEYAERMAVL